MGSASCTQCRYGHRPHAMVMARMAGRSCAPRRPVASCDMEIGQGGGDISHTPTWVQATPGLAIPSHPFWPCLAILSQPIWVACPSLDNGVQLADLTWLRGLYGNQTGPCWL
jgi:hypothetical protein